MIRCFVCFFLIGAVTGTADADGNEPIAVHKIRVERDITYASPESTDQACDIYSPSDLPANTTVPAVLVIHGGAWSSGSKEFMSRHATKLAQAGAIAISINYRLAPQHKFPAQLDDVRAALVWINDNAAKYSIDLARVGVFGYSAGGHLACLIATLADEPKANVTTTSAWSADDPRWDRLPSAVAVVAGGPPCDFCGMPPDSTVFTYFLGGTRVEKPDIYKAASPLFFASKGDCPICFIHGETDFIVPIKSSQALYEAQLSSGVKSEFVTVEKQGHMLTFLHPKTSEALLDYLTRKLSL